VTVFLVKTVSLPITGGTSALASLAAKNKFPFIGTDQSPTALRVQERPMPAFPERLKKGIEILDGEYVVLPECESAGALIAEVCHVHRNVVGGQSCHASGTPFGFYLFRRRS